MEKISDAERVCRSFGVTTQRVPSVTRKYYTSSPTRQKKWSDWSQGIDSMLYFGDQWTTLFRVVLPRGRIGYYYDGVSSFNGQSFEVFAEVREKWATNDDGTNVLKIKVELLDGNFPEEPEKEMFIRQMHGILAKGIKYYLVEDNFSLWSGADKPRSELAIFLDRECGVGLFRVRVPCPPNLQGTIKRLYKHEWEHVFTKTSIVN